MSNKSIVKQSISAVSSQTFKGPLPPPEMLARYNQLCPGFAERILQLAEREAENRHTLEQTQTEIAAKDIPAAREETKRGQWMSFVITIVAFISAVVCACINQPWVAGVIAGATLVSVVSTIMRRKS